MSALEKQKMTEAEYLAFEQASETKHEFFDGQVFAMAGASAAHNRIYISTTFTLGVQLQGGPCEIFPSDMRLNIQATRLYTYPDISVVCGEAQLVKDVVDTLLNPLLIIEILSPSTESYDRGKKFWHYRQLESLCEYVLIAQDRPQIERFLRQDDGTWVFTDASGIDGSLQLAAIDARLKLADVYQKVVFDTEDDGRENGTG